jgi:excisionase family DNA binding protein
MTEPPRKRDPNNKGTIARSKAFDSLPPDGSTASLRVMRIRVGEPEGEAVGTFLSRSGVARLLGVSPNTVTRWAREGRLPSQLTLGGHHRFERTVIESLRTEMRRAGPDTIGTDIAKG